MPDSLRDRFRALRSAAPFWSLRYLEETRESLAVRQDTLEPPGFAVDRGAMLTAVTEGGHGYCATSDVSQAGLQAALAREMRLVGDPVSHQGRVQPSQGISARHTRATGR